MKKQIGHIKLTVHANGETWDDAQFWRGAGFCSRMPDGENRTWAEQQARNLFENPKYGRMEDPDNLRWVAVKGYEPVERA